MLSKAIGELALSVGSGLTPLRSDERFWVGGTIPWLKTEQLGEKFLHDTSEKITEVALEETSIKLNPVNAISVAMYGEGKTRGSVSIIKTPMTTNQACCNVVLNPKLADYEYVYYFLKTQYENLRQLSSGVRKNLNAGDIRNFVIRLPDEIAEQQKIAAVLSALDTKIDLNQRINAELEALAKTVYDYWFVQFDFPDAHGRPYKTSGGAMVWNDALKREIPAGWGDDNIFAVAEIVGGGTPSKANADYWNGDIPFFTPTDAVGDVFQMQTDDWITQEGLKNCSSELFEKGTVFVTARGSVGKISIAGCPMAMNQSCYALKPSASERFPYVFLHAKTLIHHLKVKASGSTFNSIVTNDIEWTRLISPPSQVVSSFCKFAAPIFTRIETTQNETRELSSLRDWLLPLLMNGQVKVG
jgi:type I restriction enzyme S subunit